MGKIINCCFIKHCLRLMIDNKIFLATLVDLPCIIEGQKTLDFRTFYKSVDVSQMLYVHNKVIDDIDKKSP
jgi:TATA-binding protein-associated factor Taf7